MRPNHVMLAIITTAIWGCNFVFVALALNDIPPYLLCVLRFLLSSIPIVFFLKKPKAPFKTIFLYGFLTFTLQFSFLFAGMNLGMPPGLTSLIFQSQVFFSMFLALLFLNEKPNRMQVIGAIVSFSGLALVLTVAYDGEVQLKNIRSALEKELDPNYSKTQVTKEFLLQHADDFDHGRARFIPHTPTEQDIKKVIQFNEVLLIQDDKGYHLGICDSDGQYQTQDLADQLTFLSAYTVEQYIENKPDKDQINAVLSSLKLGIEIEQKTKTYPLLLKEYIAQAKYAHKLKHHLHAQRATTEGQQTLLAIETHLSAMEKTVGEELFTTDFLPSTKSFFTFSMTSETVRKYYYFDYKTMALFEFQNVNGIKNSDVANNKLTVVLDAQLKHSKTTLDSLPEDIQKALRDHSYTYHLKALQQWRSNNKDVWQQNRDAWNDRLISHTTYNRLALLGSGLSGVIMALGTSYLLLEAFATIPYLALIPASFIPAIILPLAIISGIAYTLLIYNSLTDMLSDNPIKKFLDRMQADDQQRWTLKTKILLTASFLLFSLSALLTICTAGTWKTVFNQPQPLFSWIRDIPDFILNIVFPSFIALSTFPFSIQNIANTIADLEDNPFLNSLISVGYRLCQAPTQIPLSIDAWQQWILTYIPGFLGISQNDFDLETAAQHWNPFRILLRLTFEPLQITLFIGHLISEGATSDQLQGFPKLLAIGLSMGLAFFEDWDYFWGHAHADDHSTRSLITERYDGSEGHNHDNNLPTLLLKFIFHPLFLAAAWWNYSWENKSCGLITVTSTSDTVSFFDIANQLECNHAILFFKEQVFYADRTTKTLKKLKVTEEQSASIELLRKASTATFSLANDTQLRIIETLKSQYDAEAIQDRFDILQGLKPQDNQPLEDIPTYRTSDDHKLFFFKSSTDGATTFLNTRCCPLLPPGTHNRHVSLELNSAMR